MKTLKNKEPLACGAFMGIDGVRLSEVEFTFSQESDSCQDGDPGQVLKVYTRDAGCGSYIVFETDRWAIDAEDIDKFCDALKRIINIPEEYEK